MEHHPVAHWLDNNVPHWSFTQNGLQLKHPISGPSYYMPILPISIFEFDCDDAMAVMFKLTFADKIIMQLDSKPTGPIPYDN